MKVMHFIRELIWPMLEGEPVNYSNQIECPQLKDDDEKKKALSFSVKMYDEQRERIKAVESKSIIFIGLFSSVIAIMSFVVKDIIMAKTLVSIIITVICSVIIIYACQVMIFAIRALERKGYTVISEKTFLNIDDNQIIQNIINSIKKNYNTINQKVDYMTMAQEFIKRIIAIFIILAFLLIVVSGHKFFSIYEINIPRFIYTINNSIYYNLVILIILLLLLIWNIIISVKLFILFKSKKSNN